MNNDDLKRIDDLLSEGQGMIDSACTICYEEGDQPHLDELRSVLQILMKVRVEIRKASRGADLFLKEENETGKK